jgi:transposase
MRTLSGSIRDVQGQFSGAMRPKRYLSNGIDKPFFEKLLGTFARTVGAGRERIIVLVLDGAGWHTEPGLTVPEGLRLVYLPPYTPEMQPAEHLWALVDQPVANRYFETVDDLEAVLAVRCRFLHEDRNLIAAHTNFHWWHNQPSRTDQPNPV